MVEYSYNAYYPANAAYWVQASIDKRFKVGDQTLWTLLYGDNQYYQARRFFFNLIRRHLNMMTGFQRRNRKSTITTPLFQGDDLADDYNGVLKWCEERDGFQEYLSQGFEGGCDTGMNLLHMYPDYTFDPVSGDLFTDNVSYQNFLIDPYFRKQDLSDCNVIWRRRWVTREVAKGLLPGRAKDIDKLRPSGAKDGKFPLQAELLNVNTSGLFTYDEYYYRTTREATVIIDPKSEESSIWDDDEHSQDDLKQILKMQPWLKVQKMQVPTVKLGILIGGHAIYHGKNLLEIDEYPFVPCLTYYEPDIQSYAWRCQGIVRNMRDAQYLYNMRKVIELDILQSQINSGWIYPVDVVTDPQAFRQSGQGFLIPLKKGHLPNEIQRIDPPSIPQSIMDLSRSLAEDITKISGVNEELLGSATDDKAGILSMLRQGAGLTTLQGIFDKLDYSQRLYGKIRLKAITKLFSKGKVRSILGREPHERFFSGHSLKYSVAVEEGNYTTTQRQMELQQLLHFREIGMPIPDEAILNAAFITNKKDIIASMQKSQQQQQEQAQAQSQEESKKTNADVMVKYTQAKMNTAKEQELTASAQEKLAKISEDLAKAEHSNTESDMNLVKMLIELENLDLENFKRSVDLAQSIKMLNNENIQQNSLQKQI